MRRETVARAIASPVGVATARRARLLERPEKAAVRSASESTAGLLSLARGDPDQATPQHIVAAAKRALDEGYTHYTARFGLLELRRAIARKLARENDITVDPDTEILVTTGAQEAVFCVMQMLLSPGDEVLMADPLWAGYDASILLAGARIVRVPTFMKDGWRLRADELERRITPRSRVIVVITPNNPAGNVMGRDELAEIAQVAKRHDLVVISDEAYEHFVYGGKKHVSMSSLQGMQERTIGIWTFSKTYAMTGWRLGWLTAPADALAALHELKYEITICAPSFSQMAGVAALDGPQDETAARRELYERRARRFVQGLNELGLTCPPLEGGICVFPDIRSTGLNSTDFCLRLIREGRLHVLPGVQYGPHGEGHIRISILAEFGVIDEALDRMARVLRRM